MTGEIIFNLDDEQGRTRYYVSPLKSEEAFYDLIEFVKQEFKCKFDEPVIGPDSVVISTFIENKEFVFVCNDMTGVQFYAIDVSSSKLAAQLAVVIEERILEVLE